MAMGEDRSDLSGTGDTERNRLNAAMADAAKIAARVQRQVYDKAEMDSVPAMTTAELDELRERFNREVEGKAGIGFIKQAAMLNRDRGDEAKEDEDDDE